jgi:endogenous inhibitor of DNA gyrase (YacG/DUF329 family)
MSSKKIKTCDCEKCGAEIGSGENYLHFPFYGWHGRDFCGKDCLIDWALSQTEIRGYLEIIEPGEK